MIPRALTGIVTPRMGSIALVALALVACSRIPAPSTPAHSTGTKTGSQSLFTTLPACSTPVLENPRYTVCMRHSGQIAQWTAYRIDLSMLKGATERTEDFREDPRVPLRNRAELDDYRGSGYDRGHLAPAALFRGSPRAMSASFLLTNVVPQAPGLNRGAWRELEAAVRRVAWRSEAVWVFTGTHGRRDRIGDGVIVPSHLWKAVLLEDQHGFRGAAAIAENTDSSAVRYVGIDDVEALTGLDFFALLPDEVEARVEAMRDELERPAPESRTASGHSPRAQQHRQLLHFRLVLESQPL